MFSLTLISGRSCLQHHYEEQRELEETNLGGGEKGVCKEREWVEEGEREGKGGRGERRGTDWIMVCVCAGELC